MTPSICTCTWLLLPCCVLVALSTGELEFYRDTVPESAKSVALRDLVQYLEAQSHQHRQTHPYPKRPYLSPFLLSQAHKKHHLQLERQREILEALANKDTIDDILGKETAKDWNYRQTRYNEPINEIPRGRERYFPFYELNPFENPVEYPDFKFPYLSRKPNEEDSNFDGEQMGKWGGYGQKESLNRLPFEDTTFDKGMKEVPVLDFHRNYGESVNEGDDRILSSIPAFTFKFDDSNLHEVRPFAVKPNDPRYYQTGPFFSDESDKSDSNKAEKNDTMWERENTVLDNSQAMHDEETRKIESDFKDSSMVVLPELERRTGYNPLVVPVNRDLNNDIYFIAIVAGCSAAAMFALVLIALTWCRLKRGAKAAADIEYPAYGVTGPNKEVSPSGDQRLAQSAQMYHFQHQKQQIIAMENRVSATRDPGSVSEAESEEENEEGDYTVYECPGLASTSEMEVKNPLFHDDPTPAAPVQSTEEDHI